MKIFYIIRNIVEYIVEGETSDLAMMNFQEHGSHCCALVQHSRSTAGCTGEKIEADDMLDALGKRQPIGLSK